jgi:RNA polymerase sigma-70 factor (ECF subfamily)
MPATAAELEQHRAALLGHCYRMLGSVIDADDAVQETLVRAWRALDRFEARASLRTWLYKIATRVCLDALADRTRRARPMEEGPAGPPVVTGLVARPRAYWLEPVPDALALPDDADPFEALRLRESIRLAFVAALQHLPPRQRAALVLADVVGWSAGEIAEALETSTAATHSALQRARATLAERDLRPAGPLTPVQAKMLERYVDAFERFDVDGLTSLLLEDATFSMPPYALWLRGPDSVRQWLTGPGAECRGSRLLLTAACGSAAYGQYRVCPSGGHAPFALIVLELSGDRIAGWNSFLDTETLFPRFGLPLALP